MLFLYKKLVLCIVRVNLIHFFDLNGIIILLVSNG